MCSQDLPRTAHLARCHSKKLRLVIASGSADCATFLFLQDEPHVLHPISDMVAGICDHDDMVLHTRGLREEPHGRCRLCFRSRSLRSHRSLTHPCTCAQISSFTSLSTRARRRAAWSRSGPAFCSNDCQVWTLARSSRQSSTSRGSASASRWASCRMALRTCVHCIMMRSSLAPSSSSRADFGRGGVRGASDATETGVRGAGARAGVTGVSVSRWKGGMRGVRRVGRGGMSHDGTNDNGREASHSIGDGGRT